MNGPIRLMVRMSAQWHDPVGADRVVDDLIVRRGSQADVSNVDCIVTGIPQEHRKTRREVGVNDVVHASRVSGNSRS